MKFVDYVTISVRSGKGGPGASHFRREKFAPKGGPDGGDGGAGGSVILQGDASLYTLLDLRYRRHHFADAGEGGDGARKSGRTADDIVIRVPLGTVVRDSETEEWIGEILRDGERLTLAQGGRGGLGNTHFKSATRQAPTYSQPGEMGEERDVTLELKLLADVGLVGFPNAGKSTLVSSVSAARPKIADYPFTTLEPNLGMVSVGDYRSFVIADIPGLIEGASEGRGLGIRFLKHVERNAVLLFCIAADDAHPAERYQTLLAELEAFSPHLLDKPRLVALTKMDLVGTDLADDWADEVSITFPPGVELFPISAVARRGLEPLLERLWSLVAAAQTAEDAEAEAESGASLADALEPDRRRASLTGPFSAPAMTTPDPRPEETANSGGAPDDLHVPPADTINPDSEVDEAMLETFPASDPPAFNEGTATAAAYPDPDDGSGTTTPEDPDAPDDASSAPPDAVGG